MQQKFSLLTVIFLYEIGLVNKRPRGRNVIQFFTTKYLFILRRTIENCREATRSSRLSNYCTYIYTLYYEFQIRSHKPFLYSSNLLSTVQTFLVVRGSNLPFDQHRRLKPSVFTFLPGTYMQVYVIFTFLEFILHRFFIYSLSIILCRISIFREFTYQLSKKIGKNITRKKFLSQSKFIKILFFQKHSFFLENKIILGRRNISIDFTLLG